MILLRSHRALDPSFIRSISQAGLAIVS